MWLSALWLACTTPGLPDAEAPRCQPEPLQPGEIRARRIQCSDEILPNGEAGQGDWLLENAKVRLAIRDATVSLTQLRGTGGTIIDAATPTGTDALVEIIPQIDGEWFESAQVESWSTANAAGLRISGTLPDGTDTDVEYTLRADSVELTLTGMDGITMVPMTNSERVGASIETPSDDGWLLFHSHGQMTDLGGWVQWATPQSIRIGAREDVHTESWPSGRTTSGQSDGDWIHVVHEEETLARLEVEDASFAGWAPDAIDGLQAVADDSDSGPVRAVRNGQSLTTGERGAIALYVTDQDGSPLPATLTWNGVDHPWLPGDGALGIGPGTGSGWVSAGPAYDTFAIDEQAISGTVNLEVQLTRQVGDALLARLDVVGAPDPSERRSSERVLHQEAAAGIRWAVLIAEDEIPRISLAEETSPWIDAQSGSRSGGPAGAPITWPWSTDNDSPAHGAAPWHLLDPLDMLDVMAKAGSRRALIDVDWMNAAGDPVDWGMKPEAIHIHSMEDLTAYTDLLNHWLPITPVGPWTWIEDIREEEYSTTEAVRGILAGRTTASTGPRLVLTVNGTGPGELLPELGLPTKRIGLQVQSAPGFEPTHAAVLTDSGEVQRWEISQSAPALLDVQTEANSPNWVIAIAWTEDGDGPWAISAPIWVGRP